MGQDATTQRTTKQMNPAAVALADFFQACLGAV